MAKSMVTLLVPTGTTVVTRDGTPYRGDYAGICAVLAVHQAELNARGYNTATTANMTTTLGTQAGHGGHAVSFTTNEY